MLSGKSEVIKALDGGSSVYVLTIEPKSDVYKKALRDWERENDISERTEESVRAFNQARVSERLIDEVWPEYVVHMYDYAAVKVSEDEVELSVCFDLLPRTELPKRFTHPTPEAHYKLPPRPTTAEWEQLYETAWTALKQKHSREFQKPDQVVAVGDMVVLDIIAKKAGVYWDEGTITNKKHLVTPEHLHPIQLFQAIQGLKVGNHHLKCNLDESFGVLAGQEVELELTIRSVLSNRLPTDEELLQSFPDLTLEKLKEQSRNSTKHKVTQQWEVDAAKMILDQAVSEMKLPEFPSKWLDVKVAQLEGEFAKRNLGVEKATVDAIIQHEVLVEAYTVTVLFNYGLLTGITRERSDSMGGYLYKCMQNLLQAHQQVVN